MQRQRYPEPILGPGRGSAARYRAHRGSLHTDTEINAYFDSAWPRAGRLHVRAHAFTYAACCRPGRSHACAGGHACTAAAVCHDAHTRQPRRRRPRRQAWSQARLGWCSPTAPRRDIS